MKSACLNRVKKELEQIRGDPVEGWLHQGPGGTYVPRESLVAEISGPKGSPFENGLFKLNVTIPDQYPFRPLIAKFVTPVYHPNIDEGGRICLDILKMPPEGSWSPKISITTCLLMIRMLLSTPNPDDGLMPEISDLYRSHYDEFKRRAAKHTLSFAGTDEPDAKRRKTEETKS